MATAANEIGPALGASIASPCAQGSTPPLRRASLDTSPPIDGGEEGLPSATAAEDGQVRGSANVCRKLKSWSAAPERYARLIRAGTPALLMFNGYETGRCKIVSCPIS
ncbi:hypothetical protein FJV77_23930 [Mesorhizobium sp. WSM4306]|nr:hypothetical protein FJV77_23930 [Mesorhizobium sp. WSM4306]